MKKVVRVTEMEMEFDDGSVMELLFGLNNNLTLEEAQKIYEQSLRLLNYMLGRDSETFESK